MREAAAAEFQAVRHPPEVVIVAQAQQPLVLEDRHTGERLELRRVLIDGEMCLELRGSLPPHSEGPPLHIHYAEHEGGAVRQGTLTAVVDGRRIQAGVGEPVELPKGSKHRWWNEGDEALEFVGYARPLVDLDRYLQAVFEVLNAGPPGRPPLIYMAHVMLRHRGTQTVLVAPRPIQAVLFRLAFVVGSITGRYRGVDWPGCPARCTGAPLMVPEDA